MADLLSVEEALARVLARAAPLVPERVPLVQAAGRVLAETSAARVDLPPFPSSAMDGFALRASETPGTLAVVARIAAGRPAPRALAAGEAMAIATGGVVPEGADAVVPLELASERDGIVRIPAAVAPGANVRGRGGDVRGGETVLGAGAVLTPARLAALAACGVVDVRCGKRPRVVVLATGTELRRPGEVLRAGEIYESNGLMLAAALTAAGAVVERLDAVGDDERAHREAIGLGLEADVLVTSGGVSVGPHDLVRATARSLGVEEIFWGVAMRPGKPLSFGARGSTLVFGLPGNPVSSLVGCLLFVCPAVLALQGAAAPEPRYSIGILAAAVARRVARDEFLRARVGIGPAGAELHPLEGQESHMIARAAAADALVHVPRGEGELAAGTPARYLPL